MRRHVSVRKLCKKIAYTYVYKILHFLWNISLSNINMSHEYKLGVYRITHNMIFLWYFSRSICGQIQNVSNYCATSVLALWSGCDGFCKIFFLINTIPSDANILQPFKIFLSNTIKKNSTLELQIPFSWLHLC